MLIYLVLICFSMAKTIWIFIIDVIDMIVYFKLKYCGRTFFGK